MGARSILVAVLGIAVAGASAFGARELLDAKTAIAATDPNAALINVVVAAHDIPFGQPIQPQMLQIISWPRTALPPGAFTDISTLVPSPGAPPRRATRAMAQGDFVLNSKISGFGEKVTIVQSLGPNSRAMAIKVNAETAVGGFVTPGDSVDIVLTQGRDAEMRAITILQNIRILGVDQQTDQQSDQPEVARTVTVEVTPEQGQTLALAQNAGMLSLSLRTLDAASDKPMDTIRLTDLLREKSPVTEVVAKKTVRIRRAGAAIETVDLN